MRGTMRESVAAGRIPQGPRSHELGMNGLDLQGKAESLPASQGFRSSVRDAVAPVGESFKNGLPNPRLAGRAGGLLLVLVATLLAGLWIFTTVGPDSEWGPLSPQREATQESSQAPKTPETTAKIKSSRQPERRATREAASEFFGEGSLRGLLTTRDGSPAPVPFVLHVGPSNSLKGRQYAEHRSEEMDSAEFVMKGLPLGGYDVWVNAPGMNSKRAPVLLTASAQHPYMIIKVSPTGYIDGFVANEDGRPAQDLRVELATMFSETRRVVQTRPDGSYLFEDVRDGEYSLSFGPLNQPLVPPRELRFSAPQMHFPKIVLPMAVDIQIRASDGWGANLADVSITGYARPKGRIDVISDASGHAWVRNLVPGNYRLSATHPDGRSAKSTLVVTEALGQEFWIGLR
jgi:hypothetical protein